MVDIELGMAPGAEDRIKAAIEAGINVEDYYAGSARLRAVIQAANTHQGIKDQLLAFVEKHVIKGADEFQVVDLGYRLAEFIESTPDAAILVILADIRDLAKLPFTRIGNTPVS